MSEAPAFFSAAHRAPWRGPSSPATQRRRVLRNLRSSRATQTTERGIQRRQASSLRLSCLCGLRVLCGEYPYQWMGSPTPLTKAAQVPDQFLRQPSASGTLRVRKYESVPSASVSSDLAQSCAAPFFACFTKGIVATTGGLEWQAGFGQRARLAPARVI